MFIRKFVSCDLNVEEVVREVISRVRPVILNLCVEVIGQGLHERFAIFRWFVNALKHIVHKVSKERFVFWREAKHPGDHVDRDGLRILHCAIDD